MDPELLIDHLVERHLVTRTEVAVLTGSDAQRGKPVERVLVDERLVEEEQMLEAMAEVYGLPLVSLGPENLDPEMASQIPRALLESFCVYPLRHQEGSSALPLATTDPFDITVEDTFRYITGLQIHPVLARRREIEAAITGELLGREGFHLLVEQIPGDYTLERLQTMLNREEDYSSESATPIIILVSAMLSEAIRMKASDIHIEPQETFLRIRYRIDGIMRTIVELPKRVEKACVSRVKIISGLDISESRRPQDGRTSMRVGKSQVDMRVSVIPTFFGEKVVLRILDRSSVLLELEQLGLSSEDYKTLHGFLQSSHGMILNTGPTGSGKTSTLYAALRILNTIDVNIMTVEDPVEYQVAGISQVQVHPKAGVTFASALRSFLRQDPDIIMVGEIRDLETAEIAVQAAQTGHLVFSTLHTNDSPTTLTRLILMGLEPHMVAGSLLCVVAQRLVRRLCPHCRQPTELTEEQAKLLSLSYEQVKPRRLFKAGACDHCDQRGYRGRLGLFELLPVTAAVRQQMLEDPSEELLWRVARSEGMRTLLEDGMAKVEAGDTSLDEVLRVVTVRRAHNLEGASPVRLTSVVCVSDVMTRKVVTVDFDTTLPEIVECFLENGISGAPVVDSQGVAVGVVSFNDLAVYSLAPPVLGGLHLKAGDVMSRTTIKLSPHDSLDKAAQCFLRHKVHRLLVEEQGKLVGVVTPLDLLSAK
ncbi:MAG: Flp pilus assembly complex ATPase component TadA [Candidatus Eremiobacteraeota bacterium]|nr:Flp pilus assembly complex ATPase component TadA [Candidatus Eremiobacteraeota bacterium]